VAQAVIRVVCETLGDSCMVLLRGKDGRLEAHGVDHSDPERRQALKLMLDAVLDPYGSLSGALTSGQTILLSSLTRHDERAPLKSELGRAMDFILYHSLMVVPLRAAGQVLGALVAARDRTTAPYTRDDLGVLEGLAEHATLAFSNARLFHRAEEEARKLRESEERLRIAQDSAEAGAWEWDLHSGQVVWSDATHRLFGVEPGSAAPTFDAWLERVHPDDRERARREFYSMPEPLRIECRMLLPTKGLRWFVAIGRPCQYEHGQPLKMAGIVLDITERKLVEEKLAQADRKKDEFLAMLAHELRNPLAAILLAIQRLRRDDIDRGRIGHLHEVIARQTDNLTRLADDLLDIARITHGIVALSKEHLAIAPVVSRAVDAARTAFSKPGQTVSVAIPSEPVSVYADAVRLEQILINLLGNAFKYTPQGGQIAVRVEVGCAWVELRVQDTGIGIAPEMLSRIFDLFEQADSSLARVGGGLGVGLTVVRRLVELHGGTVEARSAGLGRGSEFVVCLPVIHTERAELALAEPQGWADTSGRALRVLIVDDNIDILDSLAELLGSWGHHVRTAPNGTEALHIAAEVRPQLIMLDIGLPDIDGYMVAHSLRQTFGQNVCLVALTGYGQDRDRRRSSAAGFEHHLVKPLNTQELARIIDRLRLAQDE
jgi:two-component system CheB/CheR fusion protein